MSMRWYVVRRIAWTAIATYLILTITFGLIAFSPDTGEAVFAFEAATAGEDVEVARETYREIRGRDRPLFDRYVTYMTNMVTLNWGWSSTRSQPVMEALQQAYPYSLMYGIPATVLAVVLGFAIGLYSATHQYTLTDYVATFVAFFGVSIPNFWFAIMLILVFGVSLGWFPTFYDTSVAVWSFQNVKQLILPIVVLGTSAIAGQMRYARAESLEYVRAEFIKTARAKGASEWGIIRHIFRAASVPLITILVGDLLGLLFVASYLTEVVFQIPGLGLLSYNALIQQDTPLVLATTLVPVFIALVGNLLQDIAYTVLDPRIDYGDR